MLAVYIAVYFIIFMHQLCYNLLSTCIYVYIVCSWDMARQKYEIGGDNGITNIMLLSYESLKSSSSKQLHRLPETEMVTNGLIIELSKFKDNHGQCTSSMLHSWIKDLFGKNWPQTSPPTTQAIVNSVDRLIAKYRKLQKQHSSIKKEEIISSFFQEEYTLPQSGHCKHSQSSSYNSGEGTLDEIQKEKIHHLQLKNICHK